MDPNGASFFHRRDHFANVTLPGSLDHTKTTCPYPEDVVFELMGSNGSTGSTGNGNANGNGGVGKDNVGGVAVDKHTAATKEGVQWLAHREYHPNETPPPSPEACAAVIEDWAYEARAASGSLWCTYDLNQSLADNPRFNTSLAMFLLGMEAHSYFGSSGGYSDFPKQEWFW